MTNSSRYFVFSFELYSKAIERLMDISDIVSLATLHFERFE